MSVIQESTRRSLARPAARHPQVHPVRRVTAGRIRGGVKSCRSVPASAASSLLLTVKLALVAVLAVVGVGASVVGFAQQFAPEVSPVAVSGDPAWAHVMGRG